MKKVWLSELIDTRRSTFVQVVILCGIMGIFVLGCRIFGMDAYQMYTALDGVPQALKHPLMFLYEFDVSNTVRCFLLIQMVLNIPLLFYAALLPARMIGEENENGTMAFICNGPFRRRELFYGKIFACCTNYAIVILTMFVMCILVTASGTEFMYSFFCCLRVYASVLIMGLFLIHLTALYCSIKNVYTDSAEGVVSWMFLDTIIGYFYLMLMTAKDIFLAKGKIVVVNETIAKGFGMLKNFSVVQLCNPGVVYRRFPWLLMGVLVCIMVITGYLSGRIYEKKEFGWE